MTYITYEPDQLLTSNGQGDVISDIVDEINDQAEVNQTTSQFQVVNYGTIKLDPTPFNPGQVFTVSIPHTLGYKPAFMVLSFFADQYNDEDGFFSFPYYDGELNLWADTDQNSLNIHAQYTLTVSLDAYSFSFVYYLFNQPADIR